MKSNNMVRIFSWLVALCFAGTLALSGCSSTDEHPGGKSEHPSQEHPTTNAPAKNP